MTLTPLELWHVINDVCFTKGIPGFYFMKPAPPEDLSTWQSIISAIQVKEDNKKRERANLERRNALKQLKLENERLKAEIAALKENKMKPSPGETHLMSAHFE